MAKPTTTAPKKEMTSKSPTIGFPKALITTSVSVKSSMKARVNPDISRRDLHSFSSNEAQAFIVSSLMGMG
jgi:hypothetical protein